MKRFFNLFLPALIILFHFFISILSVRKQSLTFDESVNLVSGYYFVKTGQTYLNPEHPPLISVVSSFPLFILRLSEPIVPYDNPEVELYKPENSKSRYRIANKFIFENRVSHEIIIFLGRLPVIILSCFLAFLIFIWSKQLGGFYSGILSSLFYVFDPNFLAHGQLITMDVGLALFYTLSSFMYIKYILSRKIYKLLLTALFFSCTILTKFPGLLLLIVFFIIATMDGRKNLKLLLKNYSGIFFIMLFSAAAIYLFYSGGVKYYLLSLQYAINHARYGDYNFLFGAFSPKGWFYYFIISFFVKTPLATLIFILLSLYVFQKNRRNLMMYTYIIIPPLIFFTASLFSTVNIGHRYILPVYPFLFIITGLPVKEDFLRNRRYLLLSIICLLSLVYTNMRIYPHYISYFNILGGGPEKGHKILVDSNIDWGQDLKFLKKYMDESKIDEIYFAYFGSLDPQYYGIKYRFIPSSFNRYIEGADEPYKLKLPLPQKKILAVSVTYLYESIAYNWLKSVKPTSRAGYSIYIYDITENLNARLNLVRAYILVDAKDSARAELEELLKRYPQHPDVLKLKQILG